MGVTGLTKLIKGAARLVSLKELKSIIKPTGTDLLVAGIDANNFIHKFLCNRDSKCFLNSITSMIYNLFKFDILPIFIFDGKPLTDKQDELKRRSDQKLVAQQRLQELEKQFNEPQRSVSEKKQLLARIITYKNQIVSITNEHIALVKKLLRIFKLPFLDAPNDAESLACYLNKIDKIDLVITEDSDCLVFGCKYLLRGFNNQKFSGLELFNTKDIYDNVLKLSPPQIIDLAILLGNDYSSTLLPPKKSHDLLLEYKSIEGIINNIDKITKSKKFNKWKPQLDLLVNEIDYQRVRNIFGHKNEYQLLANNYLIEVNIGVGVKKLSKKRINYLQKFLVKYTENSKSVEKIINKLIRG
jgi:5'-3' exonuclease